MPAWRRHSRALWMVAPMTEREPIETYLRVELIDDEMIVVVRGGPVTTEKFIEHANRQAREFTFRARRCTRSAST